VNEAELDKILITGANGRLAKFFHRGVALDRAELDVCSTASIESAFKTHSPSAVIHLAGINLRDAESNPQLALKTNVIGTKNLADCIRAAGIPLVFISSGAVFNGPFGTEFDEDASPDPRNIYGWTKYLAELLLQQFEKTVLIIRTGWVFSPPSNQPTDFIGQMILRAKAGETILTTDDQSGSPTFVLDLVESIYRLLLEKRRGLVHLANSGAASAYDVATFICEDLNSSSNILRNSAFSDQTGIPKRSASESLKSRHLTLRPWRAALKEQMLTSKPAHA
jgi:dTDP-4-dehydrorhamnose reductase